MRNTQFWDKGMKIHSVCCFLLRNDMQVVETLFYLDCHIKFCRVKQASCTNIKRAENQFSYPSLQANLFFCVISLKLLPINKFL